MTTRFEKELNGSLGEYWQRSAKEELRKIEEEIKCGKITIDENGVARNCIGRIVTSEIAEKITYVDDRIDIEATTEAREIEDSISIARYKKAMENHKYSEEELSEMRSAFGAGTVVVDVLTGREIQL